MLDALLVLGFAVGLWLVLTAGGWWLVGGIAVGHPRKTGRRAGGRSTPTEAGSEPTRDLRGPDGPRP